MSDRAPEGLTVVLPIHNQAGAVEKALSAWVGTLDKLHRPYELLVVDDGSTDNTAGLLDTLAGRLRNMQVMRHAERRGFGASLRTALAVAKQPLFFYTGLDYPYTPADVRKLLERIQETDPDSGQRLHLVNGFRAARPVPGWRRMLGRGGRLFLRLTMGISEEPAPGWLGGRAHAYARLMRALFGLRILDVNSKFKLFRRSIFDHIPIQSDGEFVHAEILAKANFLGCLMDELPIAQRPGPFPAAETAPLPSGWKDFRRVFSHPDFGAAPVKEPLPPGPLP